MHCALACIESAWHKDADLPKAAWQIQGVQSRQELGMVLLCPKLGNGACISMQDLKAHHALALPGRQQQ